MRLVGWSRLVAAGAVAAGVALLGARLATERAGRTRPAWARTNFRGRTVNLAGGPAVAAAATASAAAAAWRAQSGGGRMTGAASRVLPPGPAGAAAALVAGLGGGVVGLYDDLVGARPEQRAKGFKGHLAALSRGQLTSGVVKLAGMGLAGLVVSVLLSAPQRAASPRPLPWQLVHVALGAGVVSGAANLLNLLDLRPGRALKVAVLAGLPLAAGPSGALAAGPVGAAVAALPADLRERTMLGDCGANAVGALLGAALVARTGPVGRAGSLAMIAGLTAASERVSFTQVIARTPVLRELDTWGRCLDDPPPVARAAGS